MHVSLRAASLKPVLVASISKLAIYSSAIIPGVILSQCSCVQAVLSWSGLPKVLLINAKSSTRVLKEDMLSKIALVSLSPCLGGNEEGSTRHSQVQLGLIGVTCRAW